MAGAIRPWVEVVNLHPDVLAENFSEDIFALDLGPLADGNPNVPAVYRDPEHFFRASYITKGLRSLLQDVLSRLTGGAGSRVLKLVTPFGGGKSHTLATLFHAARSPKALTGVPEAQGLPQLPPSAKVRTAVFDGQFFDVTNGKHIAGQKFRAQTMWGWIAWSLGQAKGYEILRKQDETHVAPGADAIMDLLADGPNLILLDEVLNYLISAGGAKIHQTTLRDETLTFIQRLTAAVGNTTNTALVFSLQSSKRESLEYVNLLQTVDHLAARKDQRREPVEGNEVLAVIQRRLLAKIPDEADATPAASAYQEIVTQMRRAHARSTGERQQAEEDGIALRDRVRTSYPFHPALIAIMRERWAAIPDFQRTRGALRFLAACLRACHREGKSRAILGPGDVPMHDSEVRLAFFKEVGQQADFQAVLEHDFLGPNARVRRIDERRAREVPSEALKRPATRLATAILMYSFGGLRREGGKEGEILPPGVSEAELLATCVGPDLDSTTALACLKEMSPTSSTGCLYLHFDGVRYCFKKDPNVTLLVEQEADAIARNERQVENKIKEMLEARLGGHREAIVWPAKPNEMPDSDPSFLVGYLPLAFGAEPRAAQEEQAKLLFEKRGAEPRSYRNGLGLAVPAADQIESLRRSVRYMLAVEGVKGKQTQLHLTDEQKQQLKEREATEKAAVESALLKLYLEVWLPRMEDGGGLGIEEVVPGGRPLQTTLKEIVVDKKTERVAAIHERVMELVTSTQRKVFDKIEAPKIERLFKLGVGSPPRNGIRVADVVEGFYSFLGFPRLQNADAIRRGIANGVTGGTFGYVTAPPPQVGPDGKFQVALDKVRFNVPVAADEIDLESGFLMMPTAVPLPAPQACPRCGQSPCRCPTTTPCPRCGQTPCQCSMPCPKCGKLPCQCPTPAVCPKCGLSPCQCPGPQREVTLQFSADRNQLFAAWNAVANLADMAGTVNVKVWAESEKGFDHSKLQNGVIEPLKEADLIE